MLKMSRDGSANITVGSSSDHAAIGPSAVAAAKNNTEGSGPGDENLQ